MADQQYDVEYCSEGCDESVLTRAFGLFTSRYKLDASGLILVDIHAPSNLFIISPGYKGAGRIERFEFRIDDTVGYKDQSQGGFPTAIQPRYTQFIIPDGDEHLKYRVQFVQYDRRADEKEDRVGFDSVDETTLASNVAANNVAIYGSSPDMLWLRIAPGYDVVHHFKNRRQQWGLPLECA